MDIRETNDLRTKLQNTCDLLIKKMGPIQIGTPQLFPFGWRKAAKGRTVWRIIEEIITQNLEKYHLEFAVDEVAPSSSEISVYDMRCSYDDMSAFINIKSAVIGGKHQKDDISKAVGLRDFYAEDGNRQFFIATFFLRFNPNMTVEISKAVVFPVAWIPDIYVNPSNNGNLQSAYYKDLDNAVKRTNEDFIPLLNQAIETAIKKKRKKRSKIKRNEIK